MRQKTHSRYYFSNYHSARFFQGKFEILSGTATLPQWKFLKRFPARFAGNFVKLCWIRASQISGLRQIATFAAAHLM
jgi:hypothetical protein